MSFTLFDRGIIVVLIVINVSLSSTLDLEDDISEQGVRERGPILFGPRLGKRTLRLINNESDRQAFLRLLEAADALKYYYGQKSYYDSQADDPDAKVTKKVIFTPKLGRSVDGQALHENVDFTPRLGRRFSVEGVTPADQQDVYRSDSDEIDKSKYFSPRLGRDQHFSPRLGRDLIYDYPEKVRLVRSANKSKST